MKKTLLATIIILLTATTASAFTSSTLLSNVVRFTPSLNTKMLIPSIYKHQSIIGKDFYKRKHVFRQYRKPAQATEKMQEAQQRNTIVISHEQYKRKLNDRMSEIKIKNEIGTDRVMYEGYKRKLPTQVKRKYLSTNRRIVSERRSRRPAFVKSKYRHHQQKSNAVNRYKNYGIPSIGR